jgi:hypothetical protein
MKFDEKLSILFVFEYIIYIILLLSAPTVRYALNLYIYAP